MLVLTPFASSSEIRRLEWIRLEAQGLLRDRLISPDDELKAIRLYIERSTTGEERGVRLMENVLYSIECEDVWRSRRHLNEHSIH